MRVGGPQPSKYKARVKSESFLAGVRALRHALLAEALDDVSKELRRDCEVEETVALGVELLIEPGEVRLQALEAGIVVEVGGEVLDALEEGLELEVERDRRTSAVIDLIRGNVGCTGPATLV